MLLAVTCAGLAVLLLVPAPPRLPYASIRVPAWPVAGGPVVVVVGGLVLGQLAVRTAVLSLVVIGAVLAAAALRRKRQRRREAIEVSRWVLETCQLLAAELAAGGPPGLALERAAQAWPTFQPVAEAFRVGADVPAELRHLASRPGAADLRLVAAAWQVANRTGHGLGEAVERVADGLRDAQASRRIVDSELASARATARLIAVLPVLALMMGSGAGGDPWGFLLGEPIGLVCLASGLAFGLAGLWWIEAIAGDVERAG